MVDYNTDYFYYSNKNGKFYKIRLKSIDNLIYSFTVLTVMHEGWRNIENYSEEQPIIEKHRSQLSKVIFNHSDYLIINVMVMISRYGPYFENKIQKLFYKELEVLFNKYPEQYILYVNDNFIETINYQFNIL